MGKRKCWLCRQSFRKGLGGEGVLSNDLICIFLLSEVGGINTCLQRGANWLKVHGVWTGQESMSPGVCGAMRQKRGLRSWRTYREPWGQERVVEDWILESSMPGEAVLDNDNILGAAMEVAKRLLELWRVNNFEQSTSARSTLWMLNSWLWHLPADKRLKAGLGLRSSRREFHWHRQEGSVEDGPGRWI